jgi:glycerol-3-phosphate cytidylyltransferase
MDKNANEKIGIIAGSFDVIHPGYVRMFKEAKTVCSKLIIALQVDPTIDRPHKCKPILNVLDREEILRSIRYIDDVVVYGSENELNRIMNTLDYDIRILGEEYKNTQFNGIEANKEIFWIKRNHVYSTTWFKQKIFEERLSQI